MGQTHRVVILGAGFGGLYAAQRMAHLKAEVTVVDRRNFHLFQPLLYQVATGSLSPGEIASPIRSILRKQANTRVILGEAIGLDPAEKMLFLKDENIPYDTLVVATGARTFYFGNDQWESIAPGLKTIEEATQIRHKVLLAFERAETAPNEDERRAWLTFVLVGGGPTGVELAGALGEIAHDTLKDDFRSIRPKDAQIIILDGSPRPLNTYPEDLSKAAEKSLINLGVRVKNKVRVVGIDENGVDYEDAGRRERVVAHTVLWAAGVMANPFGEILNKHFGVGLSKGGQVKVTPDCTVPGHPDVFVIGDLAYMEQDGKPLPGTAPVAMQQGRYVAKVIEARLSNKPEGKPFHYFDKGNLAVIGRAAAVAEIRGFHFHGLFAWLIWLFVHLMYIVEFSNRLLVFIQWGFLYLTFNRGARLITGDDKLSREAKKENTEAVKA